MGLMTSSKLLSSQGKAEPVDIIRLDENTAFHLYSNTSGKIVLEGQVDDEVDEDDDESD